MSFLLQEDGFKILQEDGNAILINEPFTTLGQAQMGGGVMRAARVVQYLAVAAPLFTGQQVFQPRLEFPAIIHRPTVHAARLPAWASSFEFPAPAPAPDLVAYSPTPWLPPRWSPAWTPSYSAPVAPVPASGRRQRIVGITIPVYEQASGSYLAVLQDDRGRIIPGSALTGLRLTLYTIRNDNAILIVNNRHNQDVLNANDVTVYNTLQTTARGVPYNLHWRIQPGDTTLSDVTLPFERHIGQLEWS